MKVPMWAEQVADHGTAGLASETSWIPHSIRRSFEWEANCLDFWPIHSGNEESQSPFAGKCVFFVCVWFCTRMHNYRLVSGKPMNWAYAIYGVHSWRSSKPLHSVSFWILWSPRDHSTRGSILVYRKIGETPQMAQLVVSR